MPMNEPAGERIPDAEAEALQRLSIHIHLPQSSKFGSPSHDSGKVPYDGFAVAFDDLELVDPLVERLYIAEIEIIWRKREHHAAVSRVPAGPPRLDAPAQHESA